MKSETTVNRCLPTSSLALLASPSRSLLVKVQIDLEVREALTIIKWGSRRRRGASGNSQLVTRQLQGMSRSVASSQEAAGVYHDTRNGTSLGPMALEENQLIHRGRLLCSRQWVGTLSRPHSPPTHSGGWSLALGRSPS